MMSYKTTITNSYGDEIYQSTKILQQHKIKAAVCKNQWTFLNRCLYHHVVPKSFRSRSTLNTRKGWNITRRYEQQIMTATRNFVKEKYLKLRRKLCDVQDELKAVMNESDFADLLRITERVKEKTFIRERERLKLKFEKLSETSRKHPESDKKQRSTSLIKTAVLNLTNDPVQPHITDLLNLGPKFVPTPKSIPVMDIVTSTEVAAIDMDKESKHHESEILRQQVSNTLSKFIHAKLPSNLSKPQRSALNDLRKDNDIKVYPFDKGSGFALLKSREALKKMSEQLGEAKKSDIDPTKSLLTKFQRTLSKMRKENKFTNSEYFDIYPSDAIPPRMYGMIKAHKPTKNFPMRAVVSTVGTVAHGTSKMLVDLIQPTLDKNTTRLKNSSSFVNEAKTWNIDNSEVQVSYDVVALYPSVPISKAVDAIMEIVQADYDDVKKRTRLTLDDIRILIQLCLSKCYFLYNDSIYEIADAGPIGLSLMVIMAEAYLQFIEQKALNIAVGKQLQPLTYRRYVDDAHARFQAIKQANDFLSILNSQDPRVQYTMETEDSNKNLGYLDLNVRNDYSGSYDFSVFRKEAITNVQIKPNSCINPRISEGVFKGFVARAHRLCSPKNLKNEMEFLVDVFTENGHERSNLEAIARNYVLPENRANQSSSSDPSEPKQRFVKIPWIPKIGPKLRRIFKSHDIKTVFTSGPNLKTLLCNNKSKLPADSYAGVYKLNCSCGYKYVGETKKKVSTRIGEHQNDILKENWKATGACEHARDCNGSFKWDEKVTIAQETNYRRRKIRESLEMKKWKTTPDQTAGLNRNYGTISTSNSWNALFKKMSL